MRFLILTQYYPPEVGAPQNRLHGLAKQLIANGAQVTILTAMPNYPAMKIHDSYRGKWHVSEEMERVNIERAWIYVSKSRSVISRLLNYFSFTFSSIIVSFGIKGNFEFLLCESPPLFLGISGWMISKFKKAKFIFNISDLWPESAEKLGIIQNKLLLNASTSLEEWLYRKSWFITGQTQGIVDNIKLRIPNKKVHWLPNGIDPVDFENSNDKSWRTGAGYATDDFILLYAGIIGYAQGLEVIIHAAQYCNDLPKVKFILVGDGPEKEKLIQLKESLNVNQVHFIDVVPKATVKRIVAAVDASVIPLRDIPLFRGAIPSKIFESLYLRKPILLGVDGEARKLFIQQGNAGLFFKPENAQDLAACVRKLFVDRELTAQLGENGKKYVINYFTRERITADFLTAIREKGD